MEPSLVLGLMLLGAELAVLAAVGFLAARAVLRQADDRLALAQGLLIGPGLWGLLANGFLFFLPSHIGAAAAWAIVLALAGWLIRRPARHTWPSGRTAAGFTLIALIVFWITLAARQLISIPDPEFHLGLAALIQSNGTPPVLPWAPWSPLFYHYGADLLIALMAPPVGPDLAFTTEVVGAYAWTGLALVVGATILRHAGWMVLAVLAPLLLTTGAWTLFFSDAPVVLRSPVPVGLPEAGVRASLADIYLPMPNWPWVLPEPEASPPNVWKPPFTLAYGLALVVLERVANGPRGLHWPSILTLSVLTGFIGLLDEAVALVVAGLWGLLGIAKTLDDRPSSSWTRSLVVHAIVGPALVGILLTAGGGVVTGLLATPSESSVVIGWIDDPGSRRPLGTLERLPGGLALLGVGPVAVAAIAAAMGYRSRLVLALAVGSGIFMLAALMLQPTWSPMNASRLDGHARNFALLALLIAAAARLGPLEARWRYVACGLLVALITWPTAVAPAHGIGQAVRGGVHLANARPGQREFDVSYPSMGREAIKPFATNAIAEYIRKLTPADTRILSPHPQLMSISTGRANASGFVGFAHLWAKQGPDFLDAIRYLEPKAIERLEIDYIHAPDDWVSELPPRAVGWLRDTRLFEPLIRDGSHVLYRVRPAFLGLNAASLPESYAALRQAVPEGASVYVARGVGDPLTEIRAAAALPHARLFGDVDGLDIDSLTAVESAPLGANRPDVVIAPREIPVGFAGPRFPVLWWNQASVAYATNGLAEAPVSVPPPTTSRVDVRLSHIRQIGSRLRFTVAFADHAPGQWTGQDWLVVAADNSPLVLPKTHESERSYVTGKWFAGHYSSGSKQAAIIYEFDAGSEQLSFEGPDGEFVRVQSSEGALGPGNWTLLARFRHGHLQAAVVPVMAIAISETGDVRFTSHEGELSVTVNPCPRYLQHAASCRQLALKADAAVAR